MTWEMSCVGIPAFTWMDLEIVTVQSVREREMSHNIPYLQNPKGNDTNELIDKTETESQT